MFHRLNSARFTVSSSDESMIERSFSRHRPWKRPCFFYFSISARHRRLRWSTAMVLLYRARWAAHLSIIKLSRFVTMIDRVQLADPIPCNLSAETKFARARGLFQPFQPFQPLRPFQAASVTRARAPSRKTVESLSIEFHAVSLGGISLSSPGYAPDLWSAYSLLRLWFLYAYVDSGSFVTSFKI